MEIKLICGATTFEACKNTIEKIDTTDLDSENIVVVPDTFSMQAEDLIFDVLNIKSTFNIEVVGISRLASKLLRKNNINFRRISKLEEVFAIFKVVKENEDKFQFFKKCDIEFCQKILQVLKKFKACKIPTRLIKPIGDENLDKKMADLKMLYEAYEKELVGRLDLSKLLEFFLEKTEKTLDLSKINLFFVNFDNFSTEVNSFICQIANYVKKIYIGYAKPISIANQYIYEDNIFKKTTELAKKYSVMVDVENVPTKLEGAHLAMAKNLFALKVDEGKDDFFLNIVPKNKSEEVEFVAKIIKKQLFEGKRLKDFAVAVPDDSYYNLIKNQFEKFGIAFYCDEATNLSQTVLGRFLLSILNFAKLETDSSLFEFLLLNPLTRTPNADEILKKIEYLKIDEEDEFLTLCPELKNVLEFEKSLKKCKKLSNFIEILRDLLNFCKNSYEKFLPQLDFDFKKQSENEQSFDLICQVFDKLESLAGEQNFTLKDFSSLLNFSFSSINVETIPSYIDAVYVGDATESYFQDVDTLFVLGATSTNLPQAKADDGIIDDDDIEKLRLEFILEPQTKVLNRRNRLKIFELLQHAKNRLIVSTPNSQDGKIAQKAGFVDDLQKMFGENVYHTELAQEFNLATLDEESKQKKLAFYIGCDDNFSQAFSSLVAKNKLPRRYVATLKSLTKTAYSQNLLEISAENKKKMKKKVFSASELENYFNCPFKHFLNYSLKIEQKETAEPNKRLFGSFQHEILQRFCNENFEKNKNDIKTFLAENLVEVAEKFYEKKFLRPDFLKFLRKESEIILKNVVYEQKYSQFRPKLLEEKIFYPLKNGHSMVGFVDRVDVCGDYFRIIDYKTGKTDSIKKDLYYGKKLQLALYALAIGEKTGLSCAGFYYFDCKTKFSKANKNQLRLIGLTRKDNDVVLLTDDRLDEENFRSDLIGMSRKKGAKAGEFAFKNGSPQENLLTLCQYAEKICEKAIDEIDDCFIEPKPLKDICESCQYFSVCKHSSTCRVMTAVKDDDFKGLK